MLRRSSRLIAKIVFADTRGTISKPLGEHEVAIMRLRRCSDFRRMTFLPLSMQAILYFRIPDHSVHFPKV
jgi:hypothetical protein